MGVRDISGAGTTDAHVLETVQSDGTFEFQQATDISTTTGNLTLSPSSGLIGVGTASPSTALHVKSETGDTAVKVQAGSASDTDGAAQVTFADWQRTASIGLMSSDIIIAKDSSIDPLSDNRRVTINVDSGNVGIGHKFGQHRPPDGSVSASVLNVENTTTSGSAQGGNLRLGSNDGAVMGSGHRLGVIEFAGSEAASPGPAGSAMAVGARIEAVTDDTWSTTENGANLDFYTTDGDAVQTKRMTVLASGNVGIGPTAPAKNLHVSKASGEATIRLQSAGYYADFYQSGANLFIQNAAGGGNTIFYDDSAERMRIDTDGNIGIGDNAPGTQLQMKGTTPYVTLKNSTSENTAGGCESKIIFEDHGDNALGQIEVSHVGTADDEKGQLVISTNNDSGLQAALTINEAQLATFSGSIAAAGVSLSNNDSGDNNTVFGLNAGDALASGGDQNVLIGENAGTDVTTGDDNVIIGYNAGDATLLSGQNVIIGSGAASAIMTADANGTVAVGYQAAAATTSGKSNTAIGKQALAAEATGDYSTAVGAGALVVQTGVDGDVYNTAVGWGAGARVQTGIKNTILGAAAAANTTDVDEAVIIGYGAGVGVLTSDADGTIIVGTGAGAALTSGDENTVVGYEALKTEDAGGGCTALGYKALTLQNVDSAKNTAVGNGAGQLVLSSTQSTYVGLEAGKGAGGDKPTGDNNTFVGYQAGHAHANDANNNTMVGHQAGDGLGVADQNTGVGSAVAFSSTDNNQTCIGYGATTAGANAVKIGNASVTNANIQVDWTIDSDERIKQDIEDNALGLSFINDLTPRKYRKLHPADWAEEIREKRYENDERDEFDDAKVWDGLIAQEVKEAVDKSGTTFSGWSVDANGKQGIQYAALVVPLIKAVQELSAQVEELKN